MLHSDYYANYRGPKLVKSVLDGTCITGKMTDLYGDLNNWQGCLWTHKEVFGNDSHGKKYRLDFKGDDGRDHWFYGFIDDINQFFNPPLATPMNQRLTDDSQSTE